MNLEILRACSNKIFKGPFFSFMEPFFAEPISCRTQNRFPEPVWYGISDMLGAGQNFWNSF